MPAWGCLTSEGAAACSWEQRVQNAASLSSHPPPPHTNHQALKGFMYAFNGVDPIEANPEFIQQLAAATQGGKGLIFACEVRLRGLGGLGLGVQDRAVG
jgi:hypothetical protein